jgi:hypothetical protein
MNASNGASDLVFAFCELCGLCERQVIALFVCARPVKFEGYFTGVKDKKMEYWNGGKME